jgi:hypothetical protein
VQKVFIGHADHCRVAVHVGDRRVAARVLLDYGIARVDASGPCGIVPFHDPVELVLLGAFRAKGSRWVFLNPGENWQGFPSEQRQSYCIRVHLN